MEEEKPVVIEPTPVVQEIKKPNPAEVLREVASLVKLNLFDDPNAVTMLKEKLTAQSTTETTLKTQVDELSKKEQLFAQKEQEYQVKITALGLGFSSEQLDEVLALAKVNTKEGETIADGLKVVKEKYGSIFVPNKNIGLNQNDRRSVKPDLPSTEQEKYLSDNPTVKMWEKQKEKYKIR